MYKAVKFLECEAIDAKVNYEKRAYKNIFESHDSNFSLCISYPKFECKHFQIPTCANVRISGGISLFLFKTYVGVKGKR